MCLRWRISQTTTISSRPIDAAYCPQLTAGRVSEGNPAVSLVVKANEFFFVSKVVVMGADPFLNGCGFVSLTDMKIVLDEDGLRVHQQTVKDEPETPQNVLELFSFVLQFVLRL